MRTQIGDLGETSDDAFVASVVAQLERGEGLKSAFAQRVA